MKKGLKQWIAVLLMLVLIVQLFPVSVFATAGDEGGVTDAAEEGTAKQEETQSYSEDNSSDDDPADDLFSDPEYPAKTYSAEDVLFEYRDFREAAVKHFRLSDSTDIAITYSYPVHYLGSDGEYYDIDNTLSLEEKEAVPSLPTEENAVEGGDEEIIVVGEENAELEEEIIISGSEMEAQSEEDPNEDNSNDNSHSVFVFI